MHRMDVETKRGKQVVDITDRVNGVLRSSTVGSGLCHIFVMHTTAALTIADLDPGTDLDMLDAYTQMIPKIKWRHPHDPSHTPDHVLAALIGPSLSVPIENDALVLGTWQRVVLFEFDGPRTRHVVITVIPER